VRRRFALLLFVTLLVIGPAGAEGPSRTPGAAATAWGIKVSVPNQSGTTTASVVSPPNGAPAVEKFAYPSDGSVVAADSSTASAVTEVKGNASAGAESVVTALSLFKGEITADAVTARASAGTGYSGAGGNEVVAIARGVERRAELGLGGADSLEGFRDGGESGRKLRDRFLPAGHASGLRVTGAGSFLFR